MAAPLQDGDGLFEGGLCGFGGHVVEISGGLGLTFEHGIDALNGADDHADGGVEVIAAEALNDEFLGEFVVVHGRNELLEFLERLVAGVAAVHNEQDAPRAGILHKAIDEIDGGNVLPDPVAF